MTTLKHDTLKLFPITDLEHSDLLMVLGRNFNELERVIDFVLTYENKHGIPLNQRVTQTTTEDGQLLTSKLNEKLVGLQGELQLADEAVTAAKLAVAAVLTDHISEEAVTADKIVANAITAVKIMAGAVTGIKIAAETITGDKIAANEITTNHIHVEGIAANRIHVGPGTQFHPEEKFKWSDYAGKTWKEVL